MRPTPNWSGDRAKPAENDLCGQNCGQPAQRATKYRAPQRRRKSKNALQRPPASAQRPSASLSTAPQSIPSARTPPCRKASVPPWHLCARAKTLAAFDRYERRATSSRNRLLRKLRALQALHRRQESVELIGPPRPRQPSKGSPFVEDVWRLEIDRVVKAAIQTGAKLPSQGGSLKSHVYVRWGPAERSHTCVCGVGLWADHGSLVLTNGQLGVQSFTLARVLTRVGGGKWLVKCPESGKMVQELYLNVDQQRFRSRHALKLRYRSKAMPAWERHWERCQKLMDRIGATHYRDLPPRPEIHAPSDVSVALRRNQNGGLMYVLRASRREPFLIPPP
jgi:hypothetical protein